MNKELVINNDPKSPVSEAFRTLRTNMQYLKNSNSKQTIVTTSTVQGEGKTWITVNLAVAFAQLGKKTLLIDSDMRVPRVHRIFEMDQYPGLSNYLSKISQTGRNEDYTFESVLKRSEIKNLTLILAGSIPPNPSELLSSGRLQELINEAKEAFDVIIFDGTPALLVTDAIIISRSVDSTIIVTSKRKTKLDDLKEVKKRIENAGGHIAGVILNRVKESSKKYESKYYYSADKRTRKHLKNPSRYNHSDMFEESEEIKKQLKSEFRGDSSNENSDTEVEKNRFNDIIQDENLILYEESTKKIEYPIFEKEVVETKPEPVEDSIIEKVKEKIVEEIKETPIEENEVISIEKEETTRPSRNKHMAEDDLVPETEVKVEIKEEEIPKKTSTRKTKTAEEKLKAAEEKKKAAEEKKKAAEEKKKAAEEKKKAAEEKKKAETAKKKTTKTATKADAKETKTKTTKTAKATKTTRTTKTTKATKAKKETKDTKEKDDFSEVKKTIGKKILDLFTEEVDEEEAKKR